MTLAYNKIGENEMPANKEKLEFRKTNNLCPRDGKPNAPNRKMCGHCLEKSAKKSERQRQKNKAKGLCLSCGQKVDNVKFCDKCKKSVAISCHDSYIKKYNLRKKMKQCTVCGIEVIGDKTTCRQCSDKQNIRQNAMHDRNRANGKCSQCGGDLDSSKGKRCQICIGKRNGWYQGSTTQIKNKTRREENREAVLQHYGSQCVRCGVSDPDCLAIDHIHGEGNTHRKKIGKWGSGFFKWLVDNNFPEVFQILCHNCNMKKHLNNGICPYKGSDIVKELGIPYSLMGETNVGTRIP